MKQIKPRHIVLVLSAVTLLLSIYYVFVPRKFLPGEFSDARIKGATVAQRIVELSRDTLSLLAKVSEFDQRRDFNDALISISDAVVVNKESQQEAIQLSSQLSAMAENLPRIEPADAREIATQAVTAEVALVSRLLYYNNYLNQLFEALKAKFAHPGISYLDGQVNDLINKINDEATQINLLNKKFTGQMAEFDQIFQ